MISKEFRRGFNFILHIFITSNVSGYMLSFTLYLKKKNSIYLIYCSTYSRKLMRDILSATLFN